MSSPPEYNVTGHDYTQRGHFAHPGPLIDVHAHVMLTRAGDPPSGPPLPKGPDSSIEQAEAALQGLRQTGQRISATFRTQELLFCERPSPLRPRVGGQ